jgi:hypothetical protein
MPRETKAARKARGRWDYVSSYGGDLEQVLAGRTVLRVVQRRDFDATHPPMGERGEPYPNVLIVFQDGTAAALTYPVEGCGCCGEEDAWHFWTPTESAR